MSKGEVGIAVPKVMGKVKWKMSKQWERFLHRSFEMMQNRGFQLVLILIGLGVAIPVIYIYLLARRFPSQQSSKDSGMKS